MCELPPMASPALATEGADSKKGPPVIPDKNYSDQDKNHLHNSSANRPNRKKVVLDSKVKYSQLRVHVLSWNIASAAPSAHDIESLFLPQESCLIPEVMDDSDLIVVGLQEAYPTMQGVMQATLPVVGQDPLIGLFSDTLRLKGFVRLSASRLLGIVTMVFVKCPLLCYIQNVETATTKTGLGGWFGNKGASSVRFSLCDLSLCFTNCHLIPHTENNSRRVQELQDIFAEQLFSSSPFLLTDHDVLVLFGDLNFRLEGKLMDEVVEQFDLGSGQKLLACDQLRLEQSISPFSPSGLHLFMEMPVSFPPSYKYKVGTDTFDGGPKRRAPAWCDRILWRTHERRLPKLTDPEPRAVLQHHYYCIHMQPRISDHKAVSAGLTVSVDLEQHVPLVVFNVMTEWVVRKIGSISFEMVGGEAVSMWDWIGLYPENFSNVDKDYVLWVYSPVKGSAVEGREYKRTLHPDQVPAEPGRYLLLYKSYLHGRVLGMSPIFPIR